MNSKLSFATKAILLAVITMLVAGLTFAQTSNGTLAGVVTDPTGASVPNAKVTVKNVGTGETRTATTNGVGAYRLESLMPGTYDVTVAAPNFSTTAIKAFPVVGSVVTSLNPSLKLGKSTETVNVEASAEVLQTESGDMSTTIGSSAVDNLPISSLNPYALASTLPGVVIGASTSFSNGTNFSVNGNRSRSNNFLIEGQDNNDAGIAGQGMQPANLEAVKEVNIQTNSYGAEFGRGGGSVSNLILKSGTNAFHGSVFENHSNSALDANDHFNNWAENPKAKYRENIYGFSFGGPIVKDKAFFFVSQQWDKYRASTEGGNLRVFTPNGIAALQALLPTLNASQKANVNTLLQVYNQPSLVNSAFRSLRSIDLGDNRGAIETGLMNRTGIPSGYDSPELDVKGDWFVTKNDTLGLRFVRTYYSTPFDLGNFPNQLPGFDSEQSGPAYNAGITYTRVITPTLFNELRMSYGRIGFTFGWRADTSNNPFVQNGLLPTVSIGGSTALTAWGPPSGTPQGRFHNTYQLQDSISWTHGKHTMKYGFDAADIRVVDTIPLSNYFGSLSYSDGCSNTATRGACVGYTGPVYTGLANFIDGFAGAGSAGQTFGSNIARSPMKYQAYFAQDSWKMRSNLTLTLGLRYEYNSPFVNDIPFPAMNINDPAPANYPQRIEQKKNLADFGPRLGFAYTPKFWTKLLGDNKTVIRGGAGLFYDHGFTNLLDNNLGGAPNDVPASLSGNATLANPRGTSGWNWAYAQARLNPVLNPYAGVTSVDANLKSPKIYQWNFNIQRELPAGFSATIGYVGTRGQHLFARDMLNPYLSDWNNPLAGNVNPTGSDYYRVFTGRGSIGIVDNTADSHYHALQAELNRRMTKGLEIRANYTYSHAIDDASAEYTTGNYSSYPLLQADTGVGRGVYDTGNSALDRRHRLALTYVYNLPKLPAYSMKDNAALGFLGHVYNGWQISGTTQFQSGAFANVQTGYYQGSYDFNFDGIGNDRPALGNPSAPVNTFGVQNGNVVCAGPAFMAGGACTPIDPSTVHWIAGEPFVAGVPTNVVGRNSYLTPGRQDWTFAIEKKVKIGERQTVAYRVDLFNPFNHANTGIPNLTLQSGIPANGDSTFGVLSPWTLGGNRWMRMSLKYSF